VDRRSAIGEALARSVRKKEEQTSHSTLQLILGIQREEQQLQQEWQLQEELQQQIDNWLAVAKQEQQQQQKGPSATLLQCDSHQEQLQERQQSWEVNLPQQVRLCLQGDLLEKGQQQQQQQQQLEQQGSQTGPLSAASSVQSITLKRQQTSAQASAGEVGLRRVTGSRSLNPSLTPSLNPSLTPSVSSRQHSQHSSSQSSLTQTSLSQSWSFGVHGGAAGTGAGAADAMRGGLGSRSSLGIEGGDLWRARPLQLEAPAAAAAAESRPMEEHLDRLSVVLASAIQSLEGEDHHHHLKQEQQKQHQNQKQSADRPPPVITNAMPVAGAVPRDPVPAWALQQQQQQRCSSYSYSAPQSPTVLNLATKQDTGAAQHRPSSCYSWSQPLHTQQQQQQPCNIRHHHHQQQQQYLESYNPAQSPVDFTLHHHHHHHQQQQQQQQQQRQKQWQQQQQQQEECGMVETCSHDKQQVQRAYSPPHSPDSPRSPHSPRNQHLLQQVFGKTMLQHQKQHHWNTHSKAAGSLLGSDKGLARQQSLTGEGSMPPWSLPASVSQSLRGSAAGLSTAALLQQLSAGHPTPGTAAQDGSNSNVPGAAAAARVAVAEVEARPAAGRVQLSDAGSRECEIGFGSRSLKPSGSVSSVDSENICLASEYLRQNWGSFIKPAKQQQQLDCVRTAGDHLAVRSSDHERTTRSAVWSLGGSGEEGAGLPLGETAASLTLATQTAGFKSAAATGRAGQAMRVQMHLPNQLPDQPGENESMMILGAHHQCTAIEVQTGTSSSSSNSAGSSSSCNSSNGGGSTGPSGPLAVTPWQEMNVQGPPAAVPVSFLPPAEALAAAAASAIAAVAGAAGVVFHQTHNAKPARASPPPSVGLSVALLPSSFSHVLLPSPPTASTSTAGRFVVPLDVQRAESPLQPLAGIGDTQQDGAGTSQVVNQQCKSKQGLLSLEEMQPHQQQQRQRQRQDCCQKMQKLPEDGTMSMAVSHEAQQQQQHVLHHHHQQQQQQEHRGHHHLHQQQHQCWYHGLDANQSQPPGAAAGALGHDTPLASSSSSNWLQEPAPEHSSNVFAGPATGTPSGALLGRFNNPYQAQGKKQTLNDWMILRSPGISSGGGAHLHQLPKRNAARAAGNLVKATLLAPAAAAEGVKRVCNSSPPAAAAAVWDSRTEAPAAAAAVVGRPMTTFTSPPPPPPPAAAAAGILPFFAISPPAAALVEGASPLRCSGRVTSSLYAAGAGVDDGGGPASPTAAQALAMTRSKSSSLPYSRWPGAVYGVTASPPAAAAAAQARMSPQDWPAAVACTPPAAPAAAAGSTPTAAPAAVLQPAGVPEPIGAAAAAVGRTVAASPGLQLASCSPHGFFHPVQPLGQPLPKAVQELWSPGISLGSRQVTPEPQKAPGVTPVMHPAAAAAVESSSGEGSSSSSREEGRCPSLGVELVCRQRWTPLAPDGGAAINSADVDTPTWNMPAAPALAVPASPAESAQAVQGPQGEQQSTQLLLAGKEKEDVEEGCGHIIEATDWVGGCCISLDQDAAGGPLIREAAAVEGPVAVASEGGSEEDLGIHIKRYQQEEEVRGVGPASYPLMSSLTSTVWGEDSLRGHSAAAATSGHKLVSGLLASPLGAASGGHRNGNAVGSPLRKGGAAEEHPKSFAPQSLVKGAGTAEAGRGGGQTPTPSAAEVSNSAKQATAAAAAAASLQWFTVRVPNSGCTPGTLAAEQQSDPAPAPAAAAPAGGGTGGISHGATAAAAHESPLGPQSFMLQTLGTLTRTTGLSESLGTASEPVSEAAGGIQAAAAAGNGGSASGTWWGNGASGGGVLAAQCDPQSFMLSTLGTANCGAQAAGVNTLQVLSYHGSDRTLQEPQLSETQHLICEGADSVSSAEEPLPLYRPPQQQYKTSRQYLQQEKHRSASWEPGVAMQAGSPLGEDYSSNPAGGAGAARPLSAAPVSSEATAGAGSQGRAAHETWGGAGHPLRSPPANVSPSRLNQMGPLGDSHCHPVVPPPHPNPSCPSYGLMTEARNSPQDLMHPGLFAEGFEGEGVARDHILSYVPVYALSIGVRDALMGVGGDTMNTPSSIGHINNNCNGGREEEDGLRKLAFLRALPALEASIGGKNSATQRLAEALETLPLAHPEVAAAAAAVVEAARRRQARALLATLVAELGSGADGAAGGGDWAVVGSGGALHALSATPACHLSRHQNLTPAPAATGGVAGGPPAAAAFAGVGRQGWQPSDQKSNQPSCQDGLLVGGQGMQGGKGNTPLGLPCSPQAADHGQGLRHLPTNQWSASQQQHQQQWQWQRQQHQQEDQIREANGAAHQQIAAGTAAAARACQSPESMCLAYPWEGGACHSTAAHLTPAAAASSHAQDSEARQYQQHISHSPPAAGLVQQDCCSGTRYYQHQHQQQGHCSPVGCYIFCSPPSSPGRGMPAGHPCNASGDMQGHQAAGGHGGAVNGSRAASPAATPAATAVHCSSVTVYCCCCNTSPAAMADTGAAAAAAGAGDNVSVAGAGASSAGIGGNHQQAQQQCYYCGAFAAGILRDDIVCSSMAQLGGPGASHGLPAIKCGKENGSGATAAAEAEAAAAVSSSAMDAAHGRDLHGCLSPGRVSLVSSFNSSIPDYPYKRSTLSGFRDSSPGKRSVWEQYAGAGGGNAVHAVQISPGRRAVAGSSNQVRERSPRGERAGRDGSPMHRAGGGNSPRPWSPAGRALRDKESGGGRNSLGGALNGRVVSGQGRDGSPLRGGKAPVAAAGARRFAGAVHSRYSSPSSNAREIHGGSAGRGQGSPGRHARDNSESSCDQGRAARGMDGGRSHAIQERDRTPQRKRGPDLESRSPSPGSAMFDSSVAMSKFPNHRRTASVLAAGMCTIDLGQGNGDLEESPAAGGGRAWRASGTIRGSLEFYPAAKDLMMMVQKRGGGCVLNGKAFGGTAPPASASVSAAAEAATAARTTAAPTAVAVAVAGRAAGAAAGAVEATPMHPAAAGVGRGVCRRLGLGKSIYDASDKEYEENVAVRVRAHEPMQGSPLYTKEEQGLQARQNLEQQQQSLHGGAEGWSSEQLVCAEAGEGGGQVLNDRAAAALKAPPCTADCGQLQYMEVAIHQLHQQQQEKLMVVSQQHLPFQEWKFEQQQQDVVGHVAWSSHAVDVEQQDVEGEEGQDGRCVQERWLRQGREEGYSSELSQAASALEAEVEVDMLKLEGKRLRRIDCAQSFGQVSGAEEQLEGEGSECSDSAGMDSAGLTQQLLFSSAGKVLQQVKAQRQQEQGKQLWLNPHENQYQQHQQQKRLCQLQQKEETGGGKHKQHEEQQQQQHPGADLQIQQQQQHEQKQKDRQQIMDQQTTSSSASASCATRQPSGRGVPPAQHLQHQQHLHGGNSSGVPKLLQERTVQQLHQVGSNVGSASLTVKQAVAAIESKELYISPAPDDADDDAVEGHKQPLWAMKQTEAGVPGGDSSGRGSGQGSGPVALRQGVTSWALRPSSAGSQDLDDVLSDVAVPVLASVRLDIGDDEGECGCIGDATAVRAAPECSVVFPGHIENDERGLGEGHVRGGSGSSSCESTTARGGGGSEGPAAYDSYALRLDESGEYLLLGRSYSGTVISPCGSMSSAVGSSWSYSAVRQPAAGSAGGRGSALSARELCSPSVANAVEGAPPRGVRGVLGAVGMAAVAAAGAVLKVNGPVKRTHGECDLVAEVVMGVRSGHVSYSTGGVSNTGDKSSSRSEGVCCLGVGSPMAAAADAAAVGVRMGGAAGKAVLLVSPSGEDTRAIELGK
jgi:hypothetical protein